MGPHIAFLKAFKRRLLLITFCCVGYGIKYYFDTRKERLTQASLPSVMDKKREALEGQIRGAIGFLNKPLLNSKGRDYQLHHLPWYLVMGPQGSGKTTLLANANMNYLLKKPIRPEDVKNISSSENCSWWVTHDTVLVDVPGHFVNLSDEKLTQPNPLWPHFLALLKKFRPERSLSGVLITLPLSDLIQSESRTQFINNLKNRISELRTAFGADLPFYLTITKCDLLPGFTEFFSDCGSDELSQAWGVTLPMTDPASLATIFTTRFNALIKRLNKQLIWRLHHERGLLERVHVKDFPLHVERLKEMLVQVLKAFANPQSYFNLQGVYLTSAIQPRQIQPGRVEAQVTTNSSQNALQIMHNPAMPSRSYFIRQLLLQGIINNFGRSQRIWQERRLVYAICAAGIAFTILFSGYDIVHTKHQMLAMQDTIVVPTFNIVMPETKSEEHKVSDSITVIG
jgi:type VI secretion system protein ImpL